MNIENEKSPEFVYTRACLEAELIPKKSLPLPPENLDWELWLEFLQSQRLAAHFYTISSKYDDFWPESIREDLRLTRYSHLLYGDIYLKKINELLRTLNDYQIPVIVLKGWALIQTLYHGDHGQRYCEDIDLLIMPKDIDKTVKLLEKLGYKGENEVWPGTCQRYTNQRIYELIPTRGYNNRIITVGLHWGLFHIPSYDPYKVNVESLFTRAKKINIAEHSVNKLRLEDDIVYLACHLELHHRMSGNLRHYYEIALLIRNNNPDWKKVIDLAKSWHHLLLLQRVVLKINSLWPNTIHNSIIELVKSLKITFKEKRVDEWITKYFGNYTLMSALMILTIPGWKRKFGVLLEQSFPSPVYMRWRYPTKNDSALIFSYLTRITLALNFIGRKIIKRDKHFE